MTLLDSVAIFDSCGISPLHLLAGSHSRPLNHALVLICFCLFVHFSCTDCLVFVMFLVAVLFSFVLNQPRYWLRRLHQSRELDVKKIFKVICYLN